VDTYTLAGRDGDVFLICSDGLTSMISDDEVGSIVRSASTLDEAADGLVRAANQSGGKDNITVILFRLGEGDPAAAPATTERPPADEDTVVGLRADELQAAASAPAAPAGDATIIRRRAEAAAAPPERPRRRRRRGRGRLALRVVLGLAVLAVVVGGLYALSRQVYFVGTNDAGLVTVYKGIPYDLPLGINLYTEDYASGMPARAIPNARRARVLDHEWRSRTDAVDLVRALERGQLDAGATN
jgi:protein phosphatase